MILQRLSKKITLIFIIFFIFISLPFGVFHAYIIERNQFTRIQQLSQVGGELSSDVLTGTLANYVELHDYDYQPMDHWEFNQTFAKKNPTSKEYFEKIGKGALQRFHTGYDQHPDVIACFTSIQEAFLQFENIEFALLIDKNGYIPVHHQKFAQPITGDLKHDFIFNRAKRIWSVFALNENAEPIVPDKLFAYKQDTGYKLFVARSRVYVNDHQWGFFICAYSNKTVMDTFAKLIGKIVFAIFVIGIVFSFGMPIVLKHIIRRYYHAVTTTY
jgi:hypothetical protein